MKKGISAKVLAAFMAIIISVPSFSFTGFAEEEERGRWAYNGNEIGARTDYGKGSSVMSGEIHDIFPESYWSYLDALKEKHPDWKFEALNTGVDWSVAVREEMAPRNNLVESGYYPTSWLDINAFNYKTNSWKVESHPDWVQANQQIVEAYMDPRNFLNENCMFQFEKLTFDADTQNLSGIAAILKGTFMDGTVLENGKTYAETFLEIGKNNNINPYHLASRVRQEQGAGRSPLISGTVKGSEGYYNYFNIEASGVTEEEIIRNGMNEAKKNGWTSRYLALEGGAKKVASYYIGQGQDTLYLQKFDVDSTTNGMFWHQYMQNLSAAESEAKGIIRAYTEMGIVNSLFTFKIPVYSNMPSAPTQKPEGNGNPNDRLKSIAVNGNELINFDSDDLTAVNYTATVSNGTKQVTVAGTPVASASTSDGKKTIDMTSDETQVPITCTAENGSKRTYTINIKRSAESAISDVQISNVTSEGYKVTLKLKDASKVSKVLFPTWTKANGQDDITWDSVTPAGTMEYNVKTSSHNNETGTYYTHVYVYDNNDQSVVEAKTITVPKENIAEKNLKIEKVEFSDITADGYKVTVKLNNADLASKVQFPTWTKANGQDDITWDTVTPADTMEHYVKTKDHNGESGQYYTHVYAYDKAGNSVMNAGSVTVPEMQDSGLQPTGLTYTTHVQNIGWQDWVDSEQMAGTEGMGLRLEAMKIKLSSGISGTIQYRTHIQNIGWQDWVDSEKLAGTEGMGLRLEAFEAKLTGELAEKYKIVYRTHVQNIGWQDWVEDGALAGTEGMGLRLEALEMKLVEK